MMYNHDQVRQRGEEVCSSVPSGLHLQSHREASSQCRQDCGNYISTGNEDNTKVTHFCENFEGDMFDIYYSSMHS